MLGVSGADQGSFEAEESDIIDLLIVRSGILR